MRRGTKQYSPFAQLLRRLLDESGIFSRAEWGTVLEVSGPAISQWLTDATLPRPEVLRRLVEVVESTPLIPREILEEFWAVAARPAAEVSPHGHRIHCRTFGHYLVRPLYEAFWRAFQTCSPQEQSQVLVAAGRLCWHFSQKRGSNSTPGPLIQHGEKEVKKEGELPPWWERLTE